MINYFDRATLSFALPLISKDLHLGPEAKGMLLSAFFWSYALMQIPMGWCADRFNLRWLYAGAFVIWSIAQGLTGFAGSLAMLIGCRMLLGIGESIYLVGGTKVVSLFFPLSQRGLPCGLFDSGTRTGLVLEGLTIGLLLSAFGWRTTFIIVGFAALIWLAVIFVSQGGCRATSPRSPRCRARRGARFSQFSRPFFRNLSRHYLRLLLVPAGNLAP
jgi:MFS family permease